MSQTAPLARVVEVLEEAKYTSVHQPAEVGGIPFEFAAMLAGDASLDLVVLIDQATEPDVDDVRRRIQGLARALDLVRSRRSLTVVFVGPQPDLGLVRSIATVARVLRVSTFSKETDITDGIAVLLPLKIGDAKPDNAETWPAVREELIKTLPDHSKPVLDAAKTSRQSVENAAGKLLEWPIRQLDESKRES